MNVREAYEIVRADFLAYIESDERYGKFEWTLTSCADFGDFYGFTFQPQGVYLKGLGYQCIDKQTGKCFCFLPQLNFALYDKRKSISISEATAM